MCVCIYREKKLLNYMYCQERKCRIYIFSLLCPVVFFYGCTNIHIDEIDDEEEKKIREKKVLRKNEKGTQRERGRAREKEKILFSSADHTTTSVAVTVVSSIIILFHRRLLLSCTRKWLYVFRLTFSDSACLSGFFFFFLSFLDFFFTTS